KQICLFNGPQQHQQNSLVNPTNPTTSNSTHRTTTDLPENIINHCTGPFTHQNLTTAATRYATSRFPFQPFIVRFDTEQVNLNQFKESIVNHFKSSHQAEVEILNCRTSKVKCNNNDIDFLLYLKNSTSFALLYDKLNWPLTIAGKEFTFPSWPSIPPQLSVIIKNVNINIEFEEFSNEVKALVHDVINVVRMNNKFGNDIHLVKLELSSTSTRQDLLNAKKLIVNYISYDVIEFLSPATVLICSKCSGIGHFRTQCTEQHETCKTCAQAFSDLKNHRCTADPVCKHCSGNHLSNSAKCPVTIVLFPYNPPQALNNSVMMKLDELMTKITDVKDHLAILSSKHDKFEQFMIDKTQQDELVKQQMDLLQKNDHELKKDLVQLKVLFERHDNMFLKLLFPMFEDLFFFIASTNQDKRGNTLDADLKCRLERYLIHVKKSRESKQCCA
ncbi:unnamed protein product, partial [Rotaria magnacalcarata]